MSGWKCKLKTNAFMLKPSVKLNDKVKSGKGTQHMLSSGFGPGPGLGNDLCSPFSWGKRITTMKSRWRVDDSTRCNNADMVTMDFFK